MVLRRDALSAAAAVLGTLVPLAEVLVTSVRAVQVEVTDQRVVDSLGAVLALEQRQAVCKTTHLWQIDTHQSRTHIGATGRHRHRYNGTPQTLVQRDSRDIGATGTTDTGAIGHQRHRYNGQHAH